MAKDEIVLSGREYRDLLRRLEEVRNHHTHRMVDGVLVKAAFDHDDEAHELAGNDDPEMKTCPQCNVITHLRAIKDLIDSKGNPAIDAPAIPDDVK